MKKKLSEIALRIKKALGRVSKLYHAELML
jgi:hypothetical protein